MDEIPEPVRLPGEVLVQVEAAAVNRLDLTVASGRLGPPPLPYVGGVEGSGVVLESDTLAPGTQVLVRGEGVGRQRPGTWSELVSAPAAAVLPIRPHLPPGVAATFMQPACAAFIALHDIARLGHAGVEGPERVIVVGATGAVGSQVVQQARAAGASVIGVVGRPQSLARIPDGVTPVLLSAAESLPELAGRVATLLVDTLGGAGLISRAAWVRPGGRVVVVGYLTGESTRMTIPEWMMTDVSLLPMNMIGRDRRARDVAGQLVPRIAGGELVVEVQRYPFERLTHALEDLEHGQVRGRAFCDLPSSGEQLMP